MIAKISQYVSSVLFDDVLIHIIGYCVCPNVRAVCSMFMRHYDADRRAKIITYARGRLSDFPYSALYMPGCWRKLGTSACDHALDISGLPPMGVSELLLSICSRDNRIHTNQSVDGDIIRGCQVDGVVNNRKFLRSRHRPMSRTPIIYMLDSLQYYPDKPLTPEDNKRHQATIKLYRNDSYRNQNLTDQEILDKHEHDRNRERKRLFSHCMSAAVYYNHPDIIEYLRDSSIGVESYCCANCAGEHYKYCLESYMSDNSLKICMDNLYMWLRNFAHSMYNLKKFSPNEIRAVAAYIVTSMSGLCNQVSLGLELPIYGQCLREDVHHVLQDLFGRALDDNDILRHYCSVVSTGHMDIEEEVEVMEKTYDRMSPDMIRYHLINQLSPAQKLSMGYLCGYLNHIKNEHTRDLHKRTRHRRGRRDHLWE